MGRPTEWVLQDFSIQPPEWRYEGRWHSADGDAEESGRWNDLGLALAWARARAPRVRVVLWVGPPRHRISYSAGTEPIADYVPWLEPIDPSPSIEPHHSGVAHIVEGTPDYVGHGTYSLYSETRNGFTGRERARPLREAVEIARSRSDVVVVGTIGTPHGYHYYNAGAADHAPDPFPAWPYGRS